MGPDGVGRCPQGSVLIHLGDPLRLPRHDARHGRLEDPKPEVVPALTLEALALGLDGQLEGGEQGLDPLLPRVQLPRGLLRPHLKLLPEFGMPSSQLGLDDEERQGVQACIGVVEVGLERLGVGVVGPLQEGRPQRALLPLRSLRGLPVLHPPRLEVPAVEGANLREPARIQGAQSRHAGERLLRPREVVQALVDRRQHRVGLEVIRIPADDRLPGDLGAVDEIELELGASHFPETFDLPRESASASIAKRRKSPGRRYFWARSTSSVKSRWHADEARSILGLEGGKKLEDGAIRLVRTDGRPQGPDQTVQAEPRRIPLVLEVSVRPQVERVVADVAAQNERVLVAKRLANSQLVEDICVVDGEIGDDQVGRQEWMEHVLADVARGDHGGRRLSVDAQLRQGGGDEHVLDHIEA